MIVTDAEQEAHIGGLKTVDSACYIYPMLAGVAARQLFPPP